MKDDTFRGISHVRMVVPLPSQELRGTFVASTACHMCFDDVPAVCIMINAVPVKNAANGLPWLPLMEAVKHACMFREPEGASVNWLPLFRVFVLSKPIPTCRLLLVFPEIL
jgi:hypothetical protein